MAGSPGGTLSPFFVTTPTPSPAAKLISPSVAHDTVVTTVTPFVISGSSPESFTTDAVAELSFSVTPFTGSRALAPLRNGMSTIAGTVEPHNAIAAAFAPAAAQEPVV
jgi:hypothetical protein